MKNVIFRFIFAVTLICYMVNFVGISGYCEPQQPDYQFCYGYFETNNEEINGYKKLMVHNEIVYISIEDFLILSNISDIKIKCTQTEYDSLTDELKSKITYSNDVYVLYKEFVDLNCWIFSINFDKAFYTSYYEGVKTVNLGGKVIALGENLSDIYIPFQTLLSIFNVPYSIEKNYIQMHDTVYTPKDYLHMECLNHLEYNLTPDDIEAGSIGNSLDYISDGLGILADFNIHKIPDFIGQTNGALPNENACEILSQMLCKVDETEKSKLLEYSDVTLNSLLPVISEISQNIITEGEDIEECFEILTEYCNNNPIININGNEIESKYLLNFVLNTEIGDKYRNLIKNEDVSDILTIGGKALEKYIAWDTVARTSTNENILNAIHSYCENYLSIGEFNNIAKFKNYKLDYTFYNDFAYDVGVIDLDLREKNGNNEPYKGLSNQIVKYINENCDKYYEENKEQRKEYQSKLIADGFLEVFENIGLDTLPNGLKKVSEITNLEILRDISSVKNIADIKSAFGILNAEWNISKFFINEANGMFDFYEADKMLLYSAGLEKDTTNAVKAIKSDLRSLGSTISIEKKDKQSIENDYWSNYCDLEYVRLKSYYISHSLVKSENEQLIKFINSLKEQDEYNYSLQENPDNIPKYIRIKSEDEYNERINYRNNLIKNEDNILDELSNYMIQVLNSKNSLENIKKTNYSKEDDVKILNICCQKITGTVKDNDGNNIDDVIISFTSGTDTHFVKSDDLSIYLKSGDYEVSISDDRYDKYTSKISLNKFSDISIDIVLIKSKTNYTWHLAPTIEAEDIINSDEDVHNFGSRRNYHYPSDEYSVIKQNGKYGIIKYDGTYYAEVDYENGGFGSFETYLYVENPHPEGATVDDFEEIAMSPDENQIKVFNYRGGRGFMKHKYLYNKADNKIYYIAYASDNAYLLNGSDASSKIYSDHEVFIAEQYDFDITKINSKHPWELTEKSYPKFGVSNKTDILVPCEYDNGCMNNCGDIVALEKDGKWGFFNQNGEQIIDFVCDSMENKKLFSDWSPYGYVYNQSKYPYLATEGYIPVKIDGKCGYYDTQGNEVIPCGTFEEVRPVHNGLAWVKKDGKWGVIELNNNSNSTDNNEQETTEDLIIETVKLTNDDIKPEWEHVTSLNLEYPVFKSTDTELQDFLTNSVTEKILGYMETNSDYPCISIYGNFEYDMSVNGYLSVSAYISNRPSDSGTGTYTIPYTFFVDLQNKKILSLNDLFSETEDIIYKEVAIKADKYNKSHAQHDTLLNYNYKECKFILTKDNLILTFNPYSISVGAEGIINIEIPLTDLDLTCIIS